MGRDKGTLNWKGEPLYLHAISKLLPVCQRVFLSVRSSQLSIYSQFSLPENACLLPDDPKYCDIGPARGLLSAHKEYPTTTWFVLAVDFPLATHETIEHLVQNYHPPATCYVHEDGHPDPFLAIWSPKALSMLEQNVDNGRTGPCHSLKLAVSQALDTYNAQHFIKPRTFDWLVNTNTPDEWNAALRKSNDAEALDLIERVTTKSF